GMYAERVDGYNPLAVADAIERKKAILEAGNGPVLLDTITYRYSGHSPSDASSYREKSEVDRWRQQDSLISYAEYLVENGHATAQQLETFRTSTVSCLVSVLKAAASLEISPRISMAGSIIGDLMFSNQCKDRMADGTPQVLIPKSESRLKTTLEKFRSALDADGHPHPR